MLEIISQRLTWGGPYTKGNQFSIANFITSDEKETLSVK